MSGEGNNDEPCVRSEVEVLSDGLRYYSMCYIAFNLVMAPLSVALWLKLRPQSRYLLNRSFPLILMISLAFLCNLISSPLGKISRDEESPLNSCFLSTFPFVTQLPTLFLAGALRVLLFLNRYKYNKKLSESFKASDFCTRSPVSPEMSLTLSKLKKRTTEAYLMKLAVPSMILIMMVSLVFYARSCPEFGRSTLCNVPNFAENEIVVISLSLTGLVVIIFLLYVHQVAKNYPDPLKIVLEIEIATVLAIIFFVPSGLLGILDVGNFTKKDPHRFDYQLIFDLGMFFMFYYTVLFEIYVGLKIIKNRRVFDEVSLSSILDNKIGRALFRQHLVNELSVENINFLDSVDAYHAIFDQSSEREDIDFMARSMINTYISQDSQNALNLPSHISLTLRQKYNEGNFQKNLFDPAYEDIFNLIQTDSFSRFRETQEFKDYIGRSALDVL